jgi:hypothetical protein
MRHQRGCWFGAVAREANSLFQRVLRPYQMTCIVASDKSYAPQRRRQLGYWDHMPLEGTSRCVAKKKSQNISEVYSADSLGVFCHKSMGFRARLRPTRD